jgi:hypothetical protein
MKKLAIASALAITVSGQVDAACTLPNSTATRVGRAQTFTYAIPQDTYSQITSAYRDVIWNNNGSASGTGTTTQFPGILNSAYTAVNRYPANNVSWGSTTVTGHDLTWFQTNHPSWVLLQADQATPAFYILYSSSMPYEYDVSYVPVDISNSAVRSFRITNEIDVIMGGGIGGVSIDNVGTTNGFELAAGICSVSVPVTVSAGSHGGYTVTPSGNCTSHGGTWTALYSPPGAACAGGSGICWTTDQATWLAQVKTEVASLGGCTIANVGYNPSDQSGTTTLIDSVDIWFDEEGFNNAAHPPTCSIAAGLTGATWIDKLAYTAARSSPKIEENAICPLNQQNRHVLQWALASHLLVKTDHAYIETYFTDDNAFDDWATGGAWPELYWTHGVTTRPTPPSSPPYGIASGTYWREFANGLVLVNPSTTASTVYDLGSGIFHTFDGLRYTGLFTLPPTTAVILINGEPSGSRPAH